MTRFKVHFAYLFTLFYFAQLGQVQAQSISFFKQKISGQCIQYSSSSGNSYTWTNHYYYTYHCPSGRVQMQEVQLIESGYTTGQSRKDFHYTGTWEIVDRGRGHMQVFYRFNNGSTTSIDISTDAYQQLFFGMAWSHCGQAQCY